MQLLLDLATFVLKFLIFIGDFVLLFILFILTLLHKTYKIFLSIFKNLKKRKNKVKKQKPPVYKKTKIIKSAKIFPLPFAIKIKYFSLGILISLTFIFIPLLVLIFLQDLPNPKILGLMQSPQTSKIFDRNGKFLFQIYSSQNRTYIPLSGIPKSLQSATIAIEDKSFYKNPGFDAKAIARAALSNLSGQSLQGGSTITQQLIKSALLTSQQSLQRKIKEIILAYWAEHIYSKDKILEMYFNQVPYGGTAWGAQAASQTYFGEDVKDLDLAQSAFLAGLPKAPSIYSPYGQRANLWKERQKNVLQKMQELGYITADQEEKALSEDLVFNPPQNPIQAAHFVMYVKDLLIQKYGIEMVEKGGLRIKTTLDLNLQNKAQDIVTDEVQKNSALNISNGAALITNPKTGEILAMVGGKDYQDANGGNVNLTTSLRQPGSSIKVITYSAALSNGSTAATILDDSPISYSVANSPTYSPVNYDGRFHGKVSLRIALANSLNIPAVKTLEKIGVAEMVALAKKMGITTWTKPGDYGLSLTLGAAEVKMTDMATAYGVLANEGKKSVLNPILEITDSQGNIVEKRENRNQSILDKGVTFILSNIISDNAARSMEFGPNSPLNISGHTVSVKTGTSDNKRDNWTIGYTPSYLVAAWVGNNDNSPMSQTLASGITGAAPIWNRIMTMLLEKKADEKPTQPSNVIQKQCLGRNEYFIKGTENLVNCAYTPTPSPTPSN